MTSIRRGIPHLFAPPGKDGKRYDLTEAQVRDLIDFENGLVYIHNVTEKTDGQTLMIGYDSEGFWTRHSGSGDERARGLGPTHVSRAERRGNSLEAARAFDEFHRYLQSNHALMSYLAYLSPVEIRGEMFNANFSRPSDTVPGHVKFIHTSYDPAKMGRVGTFVIHSQLPDNQGLDIEKLKSFRDPFVFIDDDLIDKENVAVEVFDIVEAINNLEGPDQLIEIKKTLLDRVTMVLDYLELKPKWGVETEGWIVHPDPCHPRAPRFKVVSESFKEAKARGWKR